MENPTPIPELENTLFHVIVKHVKFVKFGRASVVSAQTTFSSCCIVYVVLE